GEYVMTIETPSRAVACAVGDISCRIVSDGTMAYHDPAAVLFPNAPREELRSALHPYGVDPDNWHEYISPYSALFIETADQKLLVDTGAGGFAPTNGQLLQNLRAEGI